MTIWEPDTSNFIVEYDDTTGNLIRFIRRDPAFDKLGLSDEDLFLEIIDHNQKWNKKFGDNPDELDRDTLEAEKKAEKKRLQDDPTKETPIKPTKVR